MADNLEQNVLIKQNIFLKPYRATNDDYATFMKDVNKQLKLTLLFDNASTDNSLNKLIKTYQLIRDGLYLNKAQQVSLDYKNTENQVVSRAIYLTKDDYLKLKTLSSVETQDKTIKAYQRLQDLITGNQYILKENQLDPAIFTFELYRDRVLGLFDTFEGDFPDKADKILKGYQKSYEEALEVLEDLVTSNNPLRSGFYRMYNESPEVRQTVDAFKRALLEKAAIEENDRSEFKTMELGLMKLLQYGSLDDRLRKQILALIQQNAEGVAKVVGGDDDNYAVELDKLFKSWGFTSDKIQKPSVVALGESIQSGWNTFASKIGSLFTRSKEVAPSVSVVEPEYLKQLEKDLTTLSGEVNKILPALNASIPADALKLKMYEELLANLDLLLGLIMDIKQASTSDSSSLKALYKNLKDALKTVIDETTELNKSSQEIAELMGNITKNIAALTDLPTEESMVPPVEPAVVAPAVVEPKEVESEYNLLITEIEPIVKGMPDAQQKQILDNIKAAKEFYNSSLDDKLSPSDKKLFTDEFITIINKIKADIASDELKEWYTVSKDAYIEKQKLVSEPQVEASPAALVPRPPSGLPPLQRRRLPAMPPLPFDLVSSSQLPQPERERLPAMPPLPEIQVPTSEELLKTHTAVNVPADGWCFFYAVNGALGKSYNTGNYTVEAEKLIDAINGYYHQKFPKDIPLYTDEDKKNKRWATTNEMSLTSDLLKTCIYVYLKYSIKGESFIRKEPIKFGSTYDVSCPDNTIFLLLNIGSVDKPLPDDIYELQRYIDGRMGPGLGVHFNFFQEKVISDKTKELQTKANRIIEEYIRPETPLPPPGRPYTASLALGPPAPAGFDIVNPISEPSTKKQVQESIIKFLREQASVKNLFSNTDSKFTITELNQIIENLPKDMTSDAIDKKKANLLRIAFYVANVQENVETNDRDMSGLTEKYFLKLLGYFEKSRNPEAYKTSYVTDIDEYKQIQVDLYCLLVEQMNLLHEKPGFKSIYASYAADAKDRGFESIDTRGKDLILLDTILPKFKNDTEPPEFYPAYVQAVKKSVSIQNLLDDIKFPVHSFKYPLIDSDSSLNKSFIALKKEDTSETRKNFIVEVIQYIVSISKVIPFYKKQLLYNMFVGKQSYGQYANISTASTYRAGYINLSEVNKDMDGGAGKDEPVNPLENIKQASEKLDEYRKKLRSTQEELNSWKEKFANYDKSVDITKNFKPVEVPDRETVQLIKAFYEDLSEAYQVVLDARVEEKKAVDEGESSMKEARTKADEAAEAQKKGGPRQGEADDQAKVAIDRVAAIKLENVRNIETATKAREIAEKSFSDQLNIFLVNKFALTESNKSESLRNFVSILKKVLPGEISAASSEIEGFSKQLLSIKDLMNKVQAISQGGNYYTATEIVSIYEFLKGKSADLKKFNTERFNAMDKTIREIYQFILTTNKPLETKEKFKQKRIEFEWLLDGSENVGDDQRFKDLIIGENKKAVKGLLPTIKDIKRLMETDIDYFTSLFQQKTTSILKQQELERQQQELQVRRAQPQQGPFAAFFGQQPQKGGAEIDTEIRTKLKYYFGIDKEPTEEYEAYKNVQLYLDVFNKLIDSYKFSLQTITDPAAALALSGDKSLFNMIYEKYLKSAEDETKGAFIASQELSTALDTNNLVPRKVLRVTLRDKIIILFTTLFMRLITLSIVEYMIEKGVLKNLKFTMLAYLGFFSILFIAFTALINLDLYRLRIVFNYLNFHANSDKVFSYLLLLWAFGGIIYYIIVNVNPDINITNTSEDVKARLIYRIQVLSLIIWLFLILLVFIF